MPILLKIGHFNKIYLFFTFFSLFSSLSAFFFFCRNSFFTFDLTHKKIGAFSCEQVLFNRMNKKQFVELVGKRQSKYEMVINVNLFLRGTILSRKNVCLLIIYEIKTLFMRRNNAFMPYSIASYLKAETFILFALLILLFFCARQKV